MARIFATVFVAALVTAGCSTVEYRRVSGTEIEHEQVSRIEPHETTSADIDEWFGTADRVSAKQDGSEERRYRYTGFVDRKTEAGVYARTLTEKESKLLRLTMREGVVTRVRYRTLEPDQNITKP